jgi:hypothetical protein
MFVVYNALWCSVFRKQTGITYTLPRTVKDLDSYKPATKPDTNPEQAKGWPCASAQDAVSNQ